LPAFFPDLNLVSQTHYIFAPIAQSIVVYKIYMRNQDKMESWHLNDYAQPQGYELGQLSRPEIENATEVLIKVHAASVNPIDVKMASGAVKMMTSFK
jgi:hypothetical protein